MTVLAAVQDGGSEPSSWRLTTWSVSPSRLSCPVSPMQMIAFSPARWAALALAATTASLSPWSVRRSEWPTITALAPASASISAEMSPVWGPWSSGWQSWAPSRTVLPDSITAVWKSSVAGGQIKISVSGRGPSARRSSSDLTSARFALKPCIFQLPATSGLIALTVMPPFPSLTPAIKPLVLAANPCVA